MILQLTEKQKEEIKKLEIQRRRIDLMRTQQFVEKHGPSKVMTDKMSWLLTQIEKSTPKTLEQQEAISDYIEIYGREDERTDETIEQAEQDMIDR